MLSNQAFRKRAHSLHLRLCRMIRRGRGIRILSFQWTHRCLPSTLRSWKRDWGLSLQFATVSISKLAKEQHLMIRASQMVWVIQICHHWPNRRLSLWNRATKRRLQSMTQHPELDSSLITIPTETKQSPHLGQNLSFIVANKCLWRTKLKSRRSEIDK